jgi:hypothetical protein
MKDKELQTELTSIRSIMERSSKFISLSGLSGILAGIYALTGAAFAYAIIINPFMIMKALGNNEALFVGGIAGLVLLASVVTGYILSVRKAKRKGETIWNATSRVLLFNTGVPLLTGGLIVLLLIYWGYIGMIAPAMLLFYGLALVSASNFTFSDVKYLGLLDILLGLTAACLPDYGLLFWALGFGVLHIIYGSMMYLKYDR